MKTLFITSFILAMQLPVAAEVLLRSSFNKSLAAKPAGVWEGKEAAFVLGVEGKAVHLNGAQYISIPGDLKFNNEEGSLHFWVKTDWPGNDNQLHALIALGRKAGIRILKDEKNHLRFIWNPGGGAKQLVMGGSIAAEWPPNHWRHLAFTWKRGIYAVYLDGKEMQAGEPEEPVAPLSETTFLFLGGLKNAPGDYAVDELVLCNHALSEADILKTFVRGMEHLERRDDPRLVTYALINDKPAALILDTGCTLHALFRTFAIDAGVKPMASYRGGTMFDEEADATITLPNGANFKQRFIILKNEAGFRHDGIFGWMQFFSANRVVFEWDRRTVTPISPEAMKSITKGWTEHSFTPDGSQFRLPDCTIRIGEAEVRLPLIIDTGEGRGLTLTKKTWAQLLPRLGQAKRSYMAAWTPKSRQQTFVSFVPDSIQIFGESVRGINVEENQHHRLGVIDDEHASIGLAALSYFEVVIDGVAGKLWLKPRSTPAIREIHDFSGMLFVHRDEGTGRVYRIEVLENSPAWELGLRTNDQIIEIDGQKPDHDDIDYQIGVKDRLSNGDTISLKVRRGERTFDIAKPDAQK